jgi:CheY-like chemotaxis protein
MSILSGRRVLVIEDNTSFQFFMAMALEQEGAEVRCAGDGASAFDLYGEFMPELIISDIGLPDENGTDLLRRILAVPRTVDVPLRTIALSGISEPDEEAAVRDAGFDRLLTKPVELDQLIEQAAAVLAAPHDAG